MASPLRAPSFQLTCWYCDQGLLTFFICPLVRAEAAANQVRSPIAPGSTLDAGHRLTLLRLTVLRRTKRGRGRTIVRA
jgi:hypothetical protein